MKEKQYKQRGTTILGTTDDGYDSSIAEGSEQKMFAILSESLYSDTYGSIVRELTSNAIDATVEAKSKEPVIVGFETDDTGTSLIFKDNGVGISEERARNVFSKMLASTKEKSSDQIGSWGLGRLSAFAYSDMYYVITNYNGTKYTYVMVKKELGFRMELMNSVETEESNGTLIKIPIDYYDKSKFEDAIKKQLRYFNNVYYKGTDDVENDYKIYEGKHFKFNDKTSYHLRLHICLGNVYYPINEDKVDFSTSNLNIGLKFDIASLPVTPNRENVLYTDEVVRLINLKYKLATRELTRMYNKKAVSNDNFEEVVEIHKNGSKIVTLSETASINITRHTYNNISQTTWSKYPLLNLNYFNNSYFASCLANKFYYKHHTKTITNSHNIVWSLSDGAVAPGVYKDDEEFIPKKKRYFSSQGYNLIKWNPNLKKEYSLTGKGSKYSLIKVLSLHKYPKSEWRNIINEVISYYKTKYYDILPSAKTVAIPDTFEPKKAKINYEALRQSEGKILLKKGRKSDHYNSDTVFDSDDYKIKELTKVRKLCIYGANQDKEELAKLELLTRHNKNIVVYMTASKNFKILEQFSKFVHYEKINNMKPNEYPAVVKSLTVLYINNLLNKYKSIDKNISVLRFLKESMADKYSELQMFISDYDYSSNGFNRLDEGVKTEWLKFAIENNLLNLEWKAKADEVDKFLNKINFLDLLKTSGNYGYRSDSIAWSEDDEEVKNNPDGTYARMRQLVVDLCKLRKLRIDTVHYQEPVVEDLTEEVEEVLEEQLIKDN